MAAGFAIGAIIGPVMAWLLRSMTSEVRLPLSLGVWIMPWLGGALGAGAFMQRQGLSVGSDALQKNGQENVEERLTE